MKTMTFSRAFIFLAAGLLSSASLAAEVLVVGDSHNVGPFGEALYKTLGEELDLNIRSIGLAGASGTTYSADKEKQRTLRAGYANRKPGTNQVVAHGTPMTVPKLSELIKEEKPKIVVVELGDNFAGYASPVSDAYVKKQVQVVLQQIESSSPAPRCFWVTPIWTDREGTGLYKKTNERLLQVNRLIKEAAGNRCQVLDSTKDLGLKKEEIKVLSDGIHFGKESGKKWGQAAGVKIASVLRGSPSGSVKSSGAK